VRSRRSDASTARMMFCRLLPASQGIGPVRKKHLVATTNWSRLPCIHDPMSSSVRPKSSGGAPFGYTSAVSKKVMPASAAASMIANEVSSSLW